MSLEEEEAKAKLHRQQAKNREKYRRMRNRELKGDPARAKAVKDAWEPVTKKTLQ